MGISLRSHNGASGCAHRLMSSLDAALKTKETRWALLALGACWLVEPILSVIPLTYFGMATAYDAMNQAGWFHEYRIHSLSSHKFESAVARIAQLFAIQV